MKDDIFYTSPPNTRDTKSWEDWLHSERKMEILARRKETREMIAGDIPQIYQDTVLRKVNGTWKQVTAIGGTGDDCSTEIVTPATQELTIDQARRELKARGTTILRNGAEKRKLRRLKRQAKRRGMVW